MTVKNDLVGFLNLGEKQSGEVYSDEDIDLLTTLCSQIGVSIENAMLYEEALDSQNRLAQADKLATVGALAAGLAHEIKNPIAAIKGFAQVLDKAIDENDTEALDDFKKVVPKQLDRINNIVENLLKLSKPPKHEMKSVNINGILDDVVKLVDKLAMKQQVKITKIFENIPDTTADLEGLMQSFINLILNAIQSMPDGGRIEIKTKVTDDKNISIEISDNGIGIPKEKLLKIFDPFYTTRPEGYGLGLSSTNKTILDHHGTIKVESEIGRGTTFTVTLPIV
jgi:signal transduction histidine kinase